MPQADDAVLFPDGATQPDPHPAWLRQIVDLRLALTEPVPDDTHEAAFAEIEKLEAEIARTPARGLRGAAAQLSFVLLYITPETDRDLFAQCLQRARHTLEECIG
jgi:hypothetical protein